ncbi:MAG TPA: hypothetical protein VND15_02855 [Candidatus Acidoferrales bacterium]|nr:hypothetical protein [Candidatus Acidoferrales bacterium]
MATSKIKPMKITRMPLEKSAKAAILITLFINLAMWLGAIYRYPTLSDPKLLSLPFIYTAVIAFVFLVIHFRYALLERYPYMLNLPSFVYRLGMEKSAAVHGKVITKIFTVWCVAMLYLSIIYAGVVYLVLSPSSSSSSATPLLAFILVMLALLIVTVFALYRGIYRTLAAR